jgi:putative hydrolase of the HAD superfamily
MSLPKPVVHSIDAILFDMNGTLRIREPHEPTQHAAFSRLRELLGKENASDEYWEELTRRQKAYSTWAQEKLIQLSEEEIWTRWILPDMPPKQVESVAAELTLAWSERKGRTVPKPGAEETIVELKQRGYRLGIISNTMSSLDIPRSLVTFGWKDYFDVVILSSVIKFRKPAPEPFLEAAQMLGVLPSQCAYLGNRVSKDMIGCKRAGFALGVIIESLSGSCEDEQNLPFDADAVIHSLRELLGIFL